MIGRKERDDYDYYYYYYDGGRSSDTGYLGIESPCSVDGENEI